MEVEDLKWYSPILFLVGAILSLADPITDILTVVEFYRNDHKTLFGVGLFFIILPCLAFALLPFALRDESFLSCGILFCARTIAFGLHPFAAALARLRAFVFSVKKWWRPDDKNDKNGDKLLSYIDMSVLFESVFESAPQFIIQLYAINA